VIVARDGQEVIERMGSWGNGGGGEKRPDLMLLDINRPRANGFEVLVELRATEELAGLPVVILTASGPDGGARGGPRRQGPSRGPGAPEGSGCGGSFGAGARGAVQ